MDSCTCPVPLTDARPGFWKMCVLCGSPFNMDVWANDERTHRAQSSMRLKLNIQTAFLVDEIMQCQTRP